MRIGMITSYNAGGTWEVASSVKAALVARGHEVMLNALGRGHDLDRSWAVPLYEDMEVVHFWNIEEMKHFSDLDVPTVATIHHIPVPAEGQYCSALDKFMPNAIHVIDRFTQRQLGRWGYTNVTHIPQTFDHSKWKVLPKPETFTVGCMGDEKSHKRFDVIEAAARLAGVPCIKMLSHPWKSEAERMEFFKSISCYVVASFEDGGPLPAQEALLCGRPVVTTHVGQMDEVIETGFNGVFHNGSPEDCARAIKAAQRLVYPAGGRGCLLPARYFAIDYERLYESIQ